MIFVKHVPIMSEIDFLILQELYRDCWIYSSESKSIFQWNNNELV